ncbi:cytochrome c [Achromobacter sp. DH1f]|uniref:c-type cytochrome n=1 Tax=Achromobacter sp. DH1f TaxID=1397275 RepID=UPI001E52B3F6|nr:cytochrome c [Achromobacter sp. DH1f]
MIRAGSGSGRRRRRGRGAALSAAAAMGALAAAVALAGEASTSDVPYAAPSSAKTSVAGQPVAGKPVATPSPDSPDALRQAARADYVLKCAGCHRVDGRGSTPHGIPDFRNSVGAFVHLPAGREYLIRVPGAAYSPLSNADLAAVLNWVLLTFSPAQLPPDFQPYTEAEVAAVRPNRYPDVVPVRHGLAQELAKQGFTLSDYSYGSARKP